MKRKHTNPSAMLRSRCFPFNLDTKRKKISTQMNTDEHRWFDVKRKPSVFIRINLCPMGSDAKSFDRIAPLT
jgi:hypothetical protein